MLKWILGILGATVLVFAGLFWWLLVGFSSAPKAAPDEFDIATWRSLAGDDRAAFPIDIRVIEVGHDTAPSFVAVAGRFGGTWHTSYNAVQITTPSGTIIVGGALDRLTAEQMVQDKADWSFSDVAYTQLTDAMLSADQVLMTHEHLDHVMAIARHPAASALAPRLVMNAPQVSALPMFANGDLDPALLALTPRLDGTVQQIAPGVVIVPAAGHTPGAQLVFVTLQNGDEYLLIGDTVWSMDAIETLTTRPVLTQYVVFKPNYEDREAIKRQVSAIHAIMADNPDLTVFPSHDRVWLQQLVNEGKIGWGLAD